MFLKDVYFVNQTSYHLNQVWKKVTPGDFKSAASNYLGIFDVNQKKMQWDHVHMTMYGRYNYDFLKKTGWSDVYSYIPLPRSNIQKALVKKLWMIYKKSYMEPWVYLTWNPIYMLLLIPFIPLLSKQLPMTSVYSLFVLSQVAVLVLLEIFNWRYYYFFYLSLFFIIPMVITDFRRKLLMRDECGSA